jgi:hypothetical protein
MRLVKAHDEPDWESGIFNKPITVPQFSGRIGYFFDAMHSKGIELSLDHSKYTVTANQLSHISGTVDGVAVNNDVILTPDYFAYKLHNGANHLMVNYVQTMPLLGRTNHFALQGILKTGGGIMLPHADNRIMGHNNDVGPKEMDNWMGIGKGWWRYGGFTMGAECGLKFIPFKYAFLEATAKVAYADLSDIPIYANGTARQELWMLEGVFSFGLSF